MLAGIDGCPKAWIAITQDKSGRIASHYVDDLGSFLSQETLRIAAIDIPIGMADTGTRQCDVEARKLLGKRKSSVFRAPIRPAIYADSRPSAHEITMTIDGKGVGAQAFAIYSKVKEVDDLLRIRPEFRIKLFEIHPELSFSTWNDGNPMTHAKKTGQGFVERMALVTSVFGDNAFDGVRSQFTHKKVADDDILDAFAALWSAKRIDSGTALSCPTTPEVCPLGNSMAIWH